MRARQHAPDLDARAERGEQSGHERDGEQRGDHDDEQPSGGDRAQVGERHGEQRGESHRDGRGGDEHAVPRVGRRFHRRMLGVGAGGARFAKPADEQQRVVHAEPEAEHGDDVLERDGEWPHTCDERGGAEREPDREAADTERDRGRRHRAEGEQEEREGEWERTTLRRGDVVRARGAEIVVERILSGHHDLGGGMRCTNGHRGRGGAGAQSRHERIAGDAPAVEPDDDERTGAGTEEGAVGDVEIGERARDAGNTDRGVDEPAQRDAARGRVRAAECP